MDNAKRINDIMADGLTAPQAALWVSVCDKAQYLFNPNNPIDTEMAMSHWFDRDELAILTDIHRRAMRGYTVRFDTGVPTLAKGKTIYRDLYAIVDEGGGMVSYATTELNAIARVAQIIRKGC